MPFVTARWLRAVIVAVLGCAVATATAAAAPPANPCPPGAVLDPTGMFCSVTFHYVGAVDQHFTVPAGTTSVGVQTLGGAGGVSSGGFQANASGGQESATIPVRAGDRLTVLVGQYGQDAGTGTSAFGGGGISGASGGGGGGSFVFDPSGRLLIAAGGGGGSGAFGGHGGTGGGSNGGTDGGPSQSDATANHVPSGGLGATGTHAGAAGLAAVLTCATDGANGGPGTGPTTGPATLASGGGGAPAVSAPMGCPSSSGDPGGGGGGGYYGGGGGGSGPQSGAGGGGGSGYVEPSASPASSGTSALASGQVVITFELKPKLELKAPDPTLVNPSGTTPLPLRAVITTFAAITGASVDVTLSPSVVVPKTAQPHRVTVGNVAANSSSTVNIPGVALHPTVIADGHTLAGLTAWGKPSNEWHGPPQHPPAGKSLFGGGRLVYSDRPEYIDDSTNVKGGANGGPNVEGILYAERGKTYASTPTDREFRVYFNHENRTPVGKQVCIVFSATKLGETLEQTAIGIAHNTGDPVGAGRAALISYLGSRRAGTSKTLAVSTPVPRKGSTKKRPVLAVCPRDAVIAPRKGVVNGIIDFTATGPASVRAGLVVLNDDHADVNDFTADPPGYRFRQGTLKKPVRSSRTYASDHVLSNSNESAGHVSGTFPHDTVTLQLSDYNADEDQPWGTLIAGNPSKPLKDGGVPEDANEYEQAEDTQKYDHGNYGVFYEITVNNTGSAGETAQVLLNPRGIGKSNGVTNGFSGAVEVQGQLIKAPLSGQPGESKGANLVNPDYGIGIGRVDPGSSFSFELMPPAGSTFPLAIVLAPAFLKAQGTLNYNSGKTTSSTPSPIIFGLQPK
jgi:hypothetical protein